jgi:hypothetical protein
MGGGVSGTTTSGVLGVSRQRHKPQHKTACIIVKISMRIKLGEAKCIAALQRFGIHGWSIVGGRFVDASNQNCTSITCGAGTCCSSGTFTSLENVPLGAQIRIGPIGRILP